MPFYYKLGDSWKEVKTIMDIHNEKGEELISIYPQAMDPEQINVAVFPGKDVVVTTSRMVRIFPGQEQLVNRDDVFVEDLDTGQMRAIIHSNEPI